jgi:flagellar protein FlaG
MCLQGGNQMKIEEIGTKQTYIDMRTNAKALVKNGKEAVEKNHIEKINNEIEIVSDRAIQEHDVISAIEKANKHIRAYDRRLEFSIHKETNQIMVKVINTENDSIVREIPSEKVLDMVAHMWEVAGILIDEKR